MKVRVTQIHAGPFLGRRYLLFWQTQNTYNSVVVNSTELRDLYKAVGDLIRVEEDEEVNRNAGNHLRPASYPNPEPYK